MDLSSTNIAHFPELPFATFVLRHAPSIPNQRDLVISSPEIGALPEYALSEEGRSAFAKKEEEVLVTLSGFEQVRIVSSPFSRTLETAEMLGSWRGESVEVDPRLRERFFGELDGKNASESYGRVWEHDKSSSAHQHLGVESVDQVMLRVRELLLEWCLAWESKSFDALVLVTHGDVGQISLVAAGGIALERHRDIEPLMPGELRRLGAGA